MTDDTTSKPWGGRFTESTDAFVEDFTASIGFDQRLYRHDITGSIAHARMLAHVGIITDAEATDIVDGLEQIRTEIEQGEFSWSVGLEDIHMNIEARLIERIGEAGKKLHTGRSRNDQVATDLRLYLRDEIDDLAAALRRLQLALVELAEREADTIMPGFTHLQVAMPVSFGHHMLAWEAMLERDHAAPARLPQTGQQHAAGRGRARRHQLSASTGHSAPGCWASIRRQPTRWTPSATGILSSSSVQRPP